MDKRRATRRKRMNLIERLEGLVEMAMPIEVGELSVLTEAADELKRMNSKVFWAEDDQAELISSLGVRPIFWNGVWQAFLNETYVPVKTFKKDEDACKDWCDATNRDCVDTPTETIERMSAEHGEMNEANVRYEKEIEQLKEQLTACEDAELDAYAAGIKDAENRLEAKIELLEGVIHDLSLICGSHSADPGYELMRQKLYKARVALSEDKRMCAECGLTETVIDRDSMGAKITRCVRCKTILEIDSSEDT